ncbi:MAG: signal peptidase I [Acidimicrobiales bacterium]|nr:signal peptidase I [Hyphomonadaceae bacterium]RZV42805.1 MAG: signal peptidase I [Acidimicrobiales bacterium]
MSDTIEHKMSALGFLIEIIKIVVLAILIAFTIRTFLFQPFHIPSASMEPTLYKGDYLITSKYSIGYGKYAATPFVLPIETGRKLERIPKRGDIIVFKLNDKNDHLIKRLIGLPGDTVQMIDGKLHLNGVAQHTRQLAEETQANEVGNFIRTTIYKETLADSNNAHLVIDSVIGSEADNTPVFEVPDGHYFFMGDNRDRSLDSRRPVKLGGVGLVPATNMVGRAEFVLLAVNEEFKLFQPWTWGNIRGDRLFKGLR